MIRQGMYYEHLSNPFSSISNVKIICSVIHRIVILDWLQNIYCNNYNAIISVFLAHPVKYGTLATAGWWLVIGASTVWVSLCNRLIALLHNSGMALLCRRCRCRPAPDLAPSVILICRKKNRGCCPLPLLSPTFRISDERE